MLIFSVWSLLFMSCLALPASLDNNASNCSRQSGPFIADTARAEAVKQAFQFAWDGYYTYAFPDDELAPVSRTGTNSRNGWGASAVDALSTAILMENEQVVQVILDHVATIDWRATSDYVSVFETTIRYLGGLLSGYDLLTGPFSRLVNDRRKVETLLVQARNLADALAPAFNTPSGIPDNTINITSGERTTADATTGLAVAGTLILEWTRLSDLLGDPYYADLVYRAESHLLQPRYSSGLREPFPGLEGYTINFNSGEFKDVRGGWGGGTDSFYEYLIKQYTYAPEDESIFEERWKAAADSTLKYLTSSPDVRPDLTFVARYNGRTLIPTSSHLAGFIGGNFLLGGLVLGCYRYIEAGLKFVEAWHDTYIQDTPRIGPEQFGWRPAACDALGSDLGKTSEYVVVDQIEPEKSADEQAEIDFWRPSRNASNGSNHVRLASQVPPYSDSEIWLRCPDPLAVEEQASFYATSGFFLVDDSYGLRPEILESYYYAYRLTGDPKYQEWAWDAFTAITGSARWGAGFSSIAGLNEQVVPTDTQESFLFAEVMKYAFLIFGGGGEGAWQVNAKGGKGERWVYNTEGHPLKVRSS